MSPVRAGSARWIAAIVVAALFHGAVVWLVLRSKSEDAQASDPPPAVEIDLAPVVPAAQTPTPDVATGPKMTEAQPPPPTAATQAPNPVEATSSTPKPDTQEVAAPDALPALPPPPAPPRAQIKPVASPPVSEPQLAETAFPPKTETAPTLVSEAEATPPVADPTPDALPPPPAAAEEPVGAAEPLHDATRTIEVPTARAAEKAAEAPALSELPRGRTDKKGDTRSAAAKVKGPKPPRVLDKTISEEKFPDNRRTSAPSAVSAAARPHSAAAPTSSVGQSAAALATWKGLLVAHINRFKRFPDRALAGGTSTVTFIIDPSGRVASARLTGTSGDPLLDKEAIDLLFRASPVPSPPAELGKGTITLRVPIKFNR